MASRLVDLRYCRRFQETIGSVFRHVYEWAWNDTHAHNKDEADNAYDYYSEVRYPNAWVDIRELD